MIPLARLLVRVLSFLLLLALALLGLTIAIFSIQGGTGTLSLAGLADLVGLSAVGDEVGGFLRRLESGEQGLLTMLAGLGAILLGLLLLLGIFTPARERLLSLPGRGGDGRVGARRRPLAQAATTLVEQARGVSGAHVRVRPGRSSGGRLTVRAEHTLRADPDEVRQAVEERVRPLAEPFGLRTKVQTRLGGAGSRVQ
ncbi:MAG: DUF6286 domain-containing protein [Actinomycetota bacterium]|nr:DUF6286 domain-containing protein [Actinomycetota bacterium]